MTSWIDSLKVGDRVLDGDELITVTAVHKLHIVCGSYGKYKKTDGRLVGSSGWNRRYIREATAERVIEITENRLRSKLKNTIKNAKLNNLSTDTLQKIVDIIEAGKGVK